jgi:hypothetical protein
MKNLILILLCGLAISCSTTNKKQGSASRIVSKIDSSIEDELVLIQTFTLNANLDSVWSVYTTEQGWISWAVPMVKIDWRIGGSIKSNYNKIGKIGDATTIVNNIINYVPNKLITLQAELSPHFPDFMKDDSKNFYNVIYFTEIDKQHTLVESYGIGYRDTPKYRELLNFFLPANAGTFIKLIDYLEKGIKAEHK